MKNYNLLETALAMAEVGNCTWAQVQKEDFNFCCKTFDRAGLEKLVNDAVNSFGVETAIGLPWNIGHSGAPFSGLSRYKKHKIRDFKVNTVETTARFCGWLKVAETDEVIKEFIKRTQSNRGMNSTSTYCNLWKIVERHPSPGAFRKWILSVNRRTIQILKPYGLRPSWKALANVAEFGPRKIGKAAFRVAAKTCRQVLEKTTERYPYFLEKCSDVEVLVRLRGVKMLISEDITSAVKGLVYLGLEHSGLSVREIINTMQVLKDETDGVVMFFNVTIPYRKTVHGVTIDGGVYENGNTQFLYRLGSRSYHHYSPYGIKMILSHWKQRQSLQKQCMKEFNRADRTVLVWVKDSIAAGNCMAGTKAFMDKIGHTKPFIPAIELMKYAKENDFVARTLKLVAQSI
jgi:hypothetical protein